MINHAALFIYTQEKISVFFYLYKCLYLLYCIKIFILC